MFVYVKKLPAKELYNRNSLHHKFMTVVSGIMVTMFDVLDDNDTVILKAMIGCLSRAFSFCWCYSHGINRSKFEYNFIWSGWYSHPFIQTCRRKSAPLSLVECSCTFNSRYKNHHDGYLSINLVRLTKCMRASFQKTLFLELRSLADEKECSFFVRTGTCSFGSRCKYRHCEYMLTNLINVM